MTGHQQSTTRVPPQLSVALVGAGIGSQHLDAFLALQDLYRVPVICELDARRATPLLERAGASLSASLDEVLQRDDIDIVDICLPPQLHKQAVLDVLASGKHVICEKPLVSSLADVDDIEAAAAQSAGIVMPIFQYRYGNGIGQLRHLIDAGLAGTPLVATLETHWHRPAAYYEVPWRGKWATELGGALVGHAIHAHDLLVHVLGPVASVQASIDTRVNPIEVEDCAAIAFRLANGALATSSVTLGSADDRSRLRFCFAGLSAESGLNPYNPGTAPWTFLARDTDQSAIDAALADYTPHEEGYVRQFELAHDAFTRKIVPPVTLADARQSLEIITAIYASNASGQRMALPIGPEAPGYRSWVPSSR